MIIADYPLLPAFHGLDFNEIRSRYLNFDWTKKEADEFFSWYLESSAGARERLECYVPCPVTSSEVQWLNDLLKFAISEPGFFGTGSHIQPPSKGRSCDLIFSAPSVRFTKSAQALVFDIGAEFGNALLSRHSELRCKIERTRWKVKSAYENLPVIGEFRPRGSMNPVAIANNIASGQIREPDADVLSRTFEVWSARSSRS